MAGVSSLWPANAPSPVTDFYKRPLSHLALVSLCYNRRRKFVHSSSIRTISHIPKASSRNEIAGVSKLEDVLNFATSLYPVYVLLGGLIALVKPTAYSWFVNRGPASYSFALGTIMLSMGFTLNLSDLVEVLSKQPLAIGFGFMAQYVIMPALGAAISRTLNLSPMFSAGLILMSCCPGGTASNVVTYIARGDVPLSVIMTVCTTIGAVFVTPLLTLFYAGAYIPVDVKGLAISTLQVVLAPVLLGAWLKGSFPQGVDFIKPFSPVAAVLISSLLASSVFSVNVARLNLKDSAAMLSLLRVALGVVLVHAGGFLLGYISSRLAGYGERQSRAISIEVGMQNSSLGVVLATNHFGSPLACVPPAVSAVLMNIMGSVLAVIWRHFDTISLVQRKLLPDVERLPGIEHVIKDRMILHV